MPVRLYLKEYVERQLWRRKCKKVKQYSTSALWKTQEGFHFVVPEEGDEGQCADYVFDEILGEIDKRKS